MRIIAFINEAGSVRQILDRQGDPTRSARSGRKSRSRPAQAEPWSREQDSLNKPRRIMNRICKSLCAFCWLCFFGSSLASAAPISLQGALALSAGAANDSFAYAFVVPATSTVIIQSYGFGGSGSAPGGTNLAGTVIPAGGFDPYISLFTGAGPSATFLASNDDGSCPPGALSGGSCRDSGLSLALGPGTYTLVVTAFDNMSLAENLGTGTLGDAFTGLGNYDPTRTTNYAVDISGIAVISPAASALSIPTLHEWALAVLALLLLGCAVYVLRSGGGRRSPLNRSGICHNLPTE
jgi:IPTL-CTERM motif